MSTPTKLPADHNEAEGALELAKDQAALTQEDSVLAELIAERDKLFRQVDNFEPVVDIHNTAGMSAAKALRLQIVPIRTGLDKHLSVTTSRYHKLHKAACALKNPLLQTCKNAEEHLRDSEEFAIRYEASRKAELNAERAKLLAPWVTAEQMSTFNLSEMSEDTFTNTLVGMKAAHAARELEAQRVLQEQRRVQEADRMAREAAEAALAVERAQRAEEQRLYNEQQAKLVQERQMEEALRRSEEAQAKAAAARQAEEAAAVLAEERAIAEAERVRLANIAAEERRQREAVEQAQREKEAAERKKAAEEEAERKKAELAPDKEKLAVWLASVEKLVTERPTEIKDNNAQDLADQVREELLRVIRRVSIFIQKL